MENDKKHIGEVLLKFFNTVEAMRQAQNDYLKARNSGDLKRSKELKRKMIAYIRKPKLF